MKFFGVILAAGLGKRMKSSRPKVLHEVLGVPMLRYCVDAVRTLHPVRLVIVVGSSGEKVKEVINGRGIFFVTQKKPLGTGNALAVAKDALRGKNTIPVLAINGDSPLITSQTIKKLLTRHARNRNDLSLLSFYDESATGYGRIMRDKDSRVIRIIEEKHTTSEHRSINELNGGVYVFEQKLLKYLDRLKRHSKTGEYYLTDLVEIASRDGKKVGAYLCPPEEVRGVNTREELSQISLIMKRRIISECMKKGVTFLLPDSSFVHKDVSIGRDTIIYPNTTIEGNTSIGKNCLIYPGVRISNSIIGDSVVIRDSTVIEECRVRSNTVLGPFEHLIKKSI
jgi:bifunctional UDP-N-acetylglucosamine pyrophosphorylase/glucosamine-1-phosphate N-acetyltransferase